VISKSELNKALSTLNQWLIEHGLLNELATIKELKVIIAEYYLKQKETSVASG